MCIFCIFFYVYKINNWYYRKFKEKFQLTTPFWSVISTLLHLIVGLRPRVYYTLTNFRGGGGKAPSAPPLNTPMLLVKFQELVEIIDIKCSLAYRGGKGVLPPPLKLVKV